MPASHGNLSHGTLSYGNLIGGKLKVDEVAGERMPAKKGIP